jgi:hypothetical protein
MAKEIVSQLANKFSYKDDVTGSNFSFQFVNDDNYKKNLRAFSNLLKEALSDIEEEINNLST